MKTLNNDAKRDKQEVWLFGSIFALLLTPLFIMILTLVRNFFAFYLTLKAGEQTIINWFGAACFFASAAFIIYLISNRNK